MKKIFTLGGSAACLLLGGLLTSCEKPTPEEPTPIAATADGKEEDNTDHEEGNLISLDKLMSLFAGGRAGGATTVVLTTADAFDQPAPNLSGTTLALHQAGRAGFDRVLDNAILAPLWNNKSCVACHVGGGRSASKDGITPQLLFRVSLPGTNDDGGPKPIPGFGDQIQPIALDSTNSLGPGIGRSAEGTVAISYVEDLRRFLDGQTYALRTPTYRPTVTLPDNAMLSPRIGGQVAGLGLLEAVPEETIRAFADPDDKNKDGISGRPNYVWNAGEQRTMLGRFGWKANQPNLLQQSAGAYNGDLGSTTYYFPLESNAPGGGRNKKSGKKHQNGGLPTPFGTLDIADEELDAVALYNRTLGVPAVRNPNDAQVLAGGALFLQAKCNACHVPVMQTGPAVLAELSNQTIMPYTDLLLHDMGPGLADGPPRFPGLGLGVAHAPALGPGPGQNHERPHAAAARRPRPQRAGSRYVARRRGQSFQGVRRPPYPAGARGAGSLRERAVSKELLAFHSRAISF